MAERVTATDIVYERLRSAIVSGELAGGEQFSIYQLAERYGVSRTPVRDAVLRLADTGMLEIQRNRGVVVRGTRVSDVREVFELRLMLEVPAAARAAATGSSTLAQALDDQLDRLAAAAEQGDAAEFSAVDRRLHDLILGATGNARLVSTVSSLRDSIIAYGVSTIDRSRTFGEVRTEHEPIVEAIRKGRADEAAEAMRIHLVETGWLLMRQVAATTGENLPESWPPG